MSNLDIADELDQQLPPSRNLHESLSRAEELAARRKHSVVGLDHLLLALGQDPDAVGIMLLCELNVEGLCLELLRKLGPEAKIISPNALPPSLDISVQNLLAHASAHAGSAGQHEMSGANILSVIVNGESGFGAHKLLEAHGLDFQNAANRLAGKDSKKTETKTSPKAEAQQRSSGKPENTAKAQQNTPPGRKEAAGNKEAEGEKQPIRAHRQVKAPLSAKSADPAIPEAAYKPESRHRESGPPGPETSGPQAKGAQDRAPTGKQPDERAIKGQTLQQGGQRPETTAEPYPPTEPYPPIEPYPQAPQDGPPPQGRAPESSGDNPIPPLNEGSGRFLRRKSMPPPPMPEAREGRSQRPPVIAPLSPDGPPPLAKRQPPAAERPPETDPRAALEDDKKTALNDASLKGQQPPAREQTPERKQQSEPKEWEGMQRGIAPPPMHPANETPILPDAAGGPSRQPAPERHQPMPHFTPPPDQAPPPEAREGQPPYHPAAPEAGGPPQAGYPQAGPPPQTPHHGAEMPPDDLVVEQIPRTMRVGSIHYLEVRVARFANAEIDFGPDHYGLRAKEDKGPITKAITVRLTGNDGQFLIDSINASTQWSEIHKGVVDEADFAVWRWRVLPRKAGIANLRLDVSVRSTSEDGMSAEIPVQPSRSFTIKVRRNYLNMAKKLALLLLIFGGGFAIAKYGQQTIEAISSQIEAILKQED